MCERTAAGPPGLSLLPLSAVVSLPGDPAGSRRRRLWELARACHCPVIGVCLPLSALRRVLRKALGGEPVSDDYELQVGVVSQCLTRNTVSEAVQRELERRAAPVLRQFAAAKSPEALAALWRDALEHGDLPAALWATLTHARCDAELEEQVCRDVHMVQHQ